MGDSAKICRYCQADCTGRPRTKDAEGRYYCKACYDAALARKRRQEETSTRVGELSDDPIPAAPFGAPDLVLDALNEVIDCPGCDRPIDVDAVLCTHCGYSRESGARLGQQVETAPSDEAGTRKRFAIGAWAGFFTTPFGGSLAAIVVLWIMYALCWVTPALIGPYVIGLNGLIIVMTIVTIVVAFREGFFHGLAVIIIPLYQPFFVWGVTDNQWVRWLWTASWIAWLTPLVVGLLRGAA